MTYTYRPRGVCSRLMEIELAQALKACKAEA